MLAIPWVPEKCPSKSLEYWFVFAMRKLVKGLTKFLLDGWEVGYIWRMERSIRLWNLLESQSTVSFWAQFSIEKKYRRQDIWPKRDIDEIKGHEKHMAMVNNLYEGGRTLQRWKECSFLSALGNIGLFFFGERVAQNTKMYVTRSLS